MNIAVKPSDISEELVDRVLLGFDCSQSPDMKAFFQQYISKHQSAQ